MRNRVLPALFAVVVLTISACSSDGPTEVPVPDTVATAPTIVPEQPGAIDVAGTTVPGLMPRCDDTGACVLVVDGDLSVIETTVGRRVVVADQGVSISVAAVGDTDVAGLAVAGSAVTAETDGTWDVTVLSGRDGWSFRLTTTGAGQPEPATTDAGDVDDTTGDIEQTDSDDVDVEGGEDQ